MKVDFIDAYELGKKPVINKAKIEKLIRAFNRVIKKQPTEVSFSLNDVRDKLNTGWLSEAECKFVKVLAVQKGWNFKMMEDDHDTTTYTLTRVVNV